jgi:AcrR family transcriptional regulator
MKKGERTRRDILDAGARLATMMGLENLTIGRLATETGLSKSGLFAHFGAKEELQLAVLKHTAAMFFDEVVQPGLQAEPGIPRLMQLVDGWLRWVDRRFEGSCPFVQASVEYDDRPGRVRDLVARVQRGWFTGLSGGARSAIERGEFRSDCDPEQFAFEFYALILGYHHAARLVQDPAARERLFSAVAALVDRYRQ